MDRPFVFPVEFPAGPIASEPWSHAEPAPPQQGIFGAQELSVAFQTLIDEVNARGPCGLRSRLPEREPRRDEQEISFPRASKYIGTDVHMADNVDIAGDAHYLARTYWHKPAGRGFLDRRDWNTCHFRGCLPRQSIEPFGTGGLTFHLTHQTWPIHEEPNDFWRFSDNAMRVLFGPATGFEIVSAAMHNRTYVYPEERRETFAALPLAIAYSHVFVLARKVRDIDPAEVRWPVAQKAAERTGQPVPSAVLAEFSHSVFSEAASGHRPHFPPPRPELVCRASSDPQVLLLPPVSIPVNHCVYSARAAKLTHYKSGRDDSTAVLGSIQIFLLTDRGKKEAIRGHLRNASIHEARRDHGW